MNRQGLDGAARSAGAVRMALYRERRRRGLVCIVLELREAEIDFLVRGQYLDPQRQSDKAAIRDAMHHWLDRVCP
jgi:hypothetical protein